MIRWLVTFLLVAKTALGAELTLLSAYSWRLSDNAFGGFSSIHMNDRGNGFLATSDRGQFLSGKITVSVKGTPSNGELFVAVI